MHEEKLQGTEEDKSDDDQSVKSSLHSGSQKEVPGIDMRRVLRCVKTRPYLYKMLYYNKTGFMSFSNLPTKLALDFPRTLLYIVYLHLLLT